MQWVNLNVLVTLFAKSIRNTNALVPQSDSASKNSKDDTLPESSRLTDAALLTTTAHVAAHELQRIAHVAQGQPCAFSAVREPLKFLLG